MILSLGTEVGALRALEKPQHGQHTNKIQSLGFPCVAFPLFLAMTILVSGTIMDNPEISTLSKVRQTWVTGFRNAYLEQNIAH
jgi:hypothetical protein